jgi:hypothetical protein
MKYAIALKAEVQHFDHPTGVADGCRYRSPHDSPPFCPLLFRVAGERRYEKIAETSPGPRADLSVT